MSYFVNEFPKKSASKRAKIFKKRTCTIAKRVARSFLEARNVSFDDARLDLFAKAYAKMLTRLMSANVKDVLNAKEIGAVSQDEIIRRLVTVAKSAKMEQASPSTE